MKTARTTFQPKHVTSVDIRLGNSILWQSLCHHSGRAHIIPDLSRDLLWLPGEMPTVLERTSSPFSASVDQGSTTIGLRFNPAVTTIGIDYSWPGWRDISTFDDTRCSRISAAFLDGALHGEVDQKLQMIFDQLDHPQIRITAVANELGVSVRQLRRRTLTTTGLRPKEIHRHLRVRRYMNSDANLSPTERSLRAGFYDQAHAANELRAITGLTATGLSTLATAELTSTR